MQCAYLLEKRVSGAVFLIHLTTEPFQPNIFWKILPYKNTAVSAVSALLFNMHMTQSRLSLSYIYFFLYICII